MKPHGEDHIAQKGYLKENTASVLLLPTSRDIFHNEDFILKAIAGSPDVCAASGQVLKCDL